MDRERRCLSRGHDGAKGGPGEQLRPREVVREMGVSTALDDSKI